MKLIDVRLEKEKCTGCQACQSVCPTHAIEMNMSDNTFLYPDVRQSICIDCMACVKTCPVIKEMSFERLEEPVCYAAWNENDEIRRKSSSGGVFTSLAKFIFEKKGFVYGAAFDEDMCLVHQECNSVENLDPLMGSKYLQSNVNGIYRLIKKRLEEEEWVLFVGTPCQVAGLNGFLKKDYDQLITLDFICHGVPSAQLFSDYIRELEAKNNSKVKSYFFRRKLNGWKKFNIEIHYESGLKEEALLSQDCYMKGFLADIYLRPSCYQCSFSRLPRVADMSVADFWKVWDSMPEIYDEKGISAVLLNSVKGVEIYSRLKNIRSVETRLEWIIAGNPSLNSSVSRSSKSKLFYKLYNKKLPFSFIIKECFPEPNYWEKLCWSLSKRIYKIRKK